MINLLFDVENQWDKKTDYFICEEKALSILFDNNYDNYVLVTSNKCLSCHSCKL